MPAKVSVTGGPETARAFDQLQSDVSNLQETHRKVAQARLDGVVRRTPVLTGSLVSSFTVAATNTAGSIISPLQHAMPIEYGTRFVSGVHMVRDTLDADEAALLKEYEASILDRAKARGFRVD